MKFHNYLLIAALAALACGCSSDEPTTSADDNVSNNPYERIELSRGEALVSYAGYEFAWNLFDKVNSEAKGENVCISPTSMNIALTMLLNGATGETQEEIISTLGLDGMSVEEINENSRFMVDQLLNRDKGCTIHSANSFWTLAPYFIKSQYKSTLMDNFNAALETTTEENFAADVNNWFSENTNGLINNMLDPNEHDDCAILNALYFQNIWNKSVKFSGSSLTDFNNCDGTVGKASFMKGNVECQYNESEHARHAHIAFGNGAYKMSVTLPKDGSTIEQCIAELKNLETFRRINNAELDLTLPKFQISSLLTLNEAIEALGIKKAFDKDNAEFWNISDVPMYVTKVKQGTYFKIDEKGVTAAAATSIAVGFTSAMTVHPEPMIVDSPFIFTIYETSTNCLLFAGKIEKL